MLEPRSWTSFRQVFHSEGSCDPRLPTAAFDFDSTLRPHRGRGPPEELTLRFLAGLAASFNLVIVSNRSSAKPAALSPLREYVAALDERTAGAGRVTVYAPTARDRDRKPHTGTWEHYLGSLCGGASPPFAFFCGDAAGRPGDFAATDYAFALNNGLAFLTPEALFRGGGDPWALLEGARGGPAAPAPLCFAETAGPGAGPLRDRAMESLRALVLAVARGRDPFPQIALVLCGSPASGKTRLRRSLPGLFGEGGPEFLFDLVSRDEQGAAHWKAFLGALDARRNVVVDGTNPTRAARAAFARPAARRGYAVIICHVDTPKDACFHLNAARCQLDPTGGTPELPPVALNTYWSRREVPTEAEARDLIVFPFALSPGAPREVAEFRYALG